MALRAGADVALRGARARVRGGRALVVVARGPLARWPGDVALGEASSRSSGCPWRRR